MTQQWIVTVSSGEYSAYQIEIAGVYPTKEDAFERMCDLAAPLTRMPSWDKYNDDEGPQDVHIESGDRFVRLTTKAIHMWRDVTIEATLARNDTCAEDILSAFTWHSPREPT